MLQARTQESAPEGDRCGGTSSSGDGACSTIPEETAGPFPGDGSNGPDLLTASGVVRSEDERVQHVASQKAIERIERVGDGTNPAA